VVDSAILASKLAAIRDAVTRIRATLPESPGRFESDRTAREIVTLNLFVAIQECLALATHWLADEGWDVPKTYGEAFSVLADRGILERSLADRLRAAAGLRNLIAHRYGILDPARLFEFASSGTSDLLAFGEQLARHAQRGGSKDSGAAD